MRLSAAFIPGAVVCLLGFAALADRALVGRAAALRSNAALRIDDDARQAAASVSLTLARLEQAAAAGREAEELRVERLAIRPDRHVSPGGFRSYGARSRAELIALLSSEGVTPNGLPEAAVARIALGPGAPVSGPASESVEDRLLGGRLPVGADDLAPLARELGVGADTRLAALETRLRRAPAAGDLPLAPAFARTVRSDHRIEGWARTPEGRALRYELPTSTLLAAAATERGTLVEPGGPARDSQLSLVVAVPDLPGLRLRFEPRLEPGFRLTLLRASLWASAALGVLAVIGLARARAREARALARERAFLASITHELRTPLAALRALGETLARGRGAPVEYGALVARETERLEQLVEQVLTLSRMDHVPRYASADPAELLRSAVALVAPRARRRDAQLGVSVESDLPECRWDGDAVRRAVLNLLDNAITHGRKGGRVEVRASVDGSGVRLSVQDDGPGLGGADRRRIFGRFERGATDAPGTGLGLYLVDQVARAHGGRVELATAERGCTFSLVLPSDPPDLDAKLQA